MRNSFRKSYTKWVKAAGGYVKGQWVDGDSVASTFSASVQPLNMASVNALAALHQGRYIHSAVKIYTDEVLNVAGENDNNGDEVEYLNQRYLVISRDSFQSSVINHFRYTAVRSGNNE